jgi:hypothetical protein
LDSKELTEAGGILAVEGELFDEAHEAELHVIHLEMLFAVSVLLVRELACLINEAILLFQFAVGRRLQKDNGTRFFCALLVSFFFLACGLAY